LIEQEIGVARQQPGSVVCAARIRRNAWSKCRCAASRFPSRSASSAATLCAAMSTPSVTPSGRGDGFLERCKRAVGVAGETACGGNAGRGDERTHVRRRGFTIAPRRLRVALAQPQRCASQTSRVRLRSGAVDQRLEIDFCGGVVQAGEPQARSQ
jgi:hypothetical protein